MSGQFANKQFAGDQFAGKQFGANEGDSGILWMSADLTGAGGVVASIVGVEESTRRSRRNARLRPIREGLAHPTALLSKSETAVLHAAGARVLCLEVVAFARAVVSSGQVGMPRPLGVVSIAGLVRTSIPRPVRGSVAELHAAGAAAARCQPVVGVALSVDARALGGGAAMPGVEVVGTFVQPMRGQGVRNPSDEEFVAMVLALRKRRLTSRSAGRILRRS